MPFSPSRLSWIRSGLFWRTFFLLGFLLAISMGTWVASFRFVERGPVAQQFAAQLVSMVTITRAALAHSAPDLRRELLFDLASNEGIRVYPLETSDRIEPLSDDALLERLQKSVRDKLGQDTKFAAKVNDIPGFWISFKLEDDDEYWLMLERRRFERVSGLQWFGWGAIVLLLSLLGAGFISRLINLPLSRLASAARSMARGETPPPLPEVGPVEIRQANSSFNHMVSDLTRLESDRALILAGISHDLRTPLARMQLELEMANLTEDERAGLRSDIHQIDLIIGQFLEYARSAERSDFTLVDLSETLSDAAREAERIPGIEIEVALEKNVFVRGNATELRRVFDNLLENARRYGKMAEDSQAEVLVSLTDKSGKALVEISDRGPGVPEAELKRLLHPFARLDAARGQANGAGLGLAIVDRVIKRHDGTLQLKNREYGGLAVLIMLPLG
jgi:two-component system osmolarity sensor histidine kinase EnvZ